MEKQQNKRALLSECIKQFSSKEKTENKKRILSLYSVQGIYLDAFPSTYVVGISSICNLHCPLCLTGCKKQKKENMFMPLDAYKSVISKIHPYAEWVWLYNWGESFLHPDFIEMLKIAGSHKICVQISSNLNVNQEDSFWEQIVTVPLHHLIVSFDGTKQDSYQKYRIGGDLSLVKANIKKVVEIKKRLNSKYPFIELQFLKHRYNLGDENELEEVAEELGVDNYYSTELTMPFMEKDQSRAKSWLRDEVYNQWISNDMDDWILQGQVCPFLYKFMTIESDLSMPACCYSNYPENDFCSWDDSKSLKEIWNSEKYISARKLFLEKKSEGEIICSQCSAYKHFKDNIKNRK